MDGEAQAKTDSCFSDDKIRASTSTAISKAASTAVSTSASAAVSTSASASTSTATSTSASAFTSISAGLEIFSNVTIPAFNRNTTLTTPASYRNTTSYSASEYFHGDAIIYAICFTAGICLNGLVIASVLKTYRLRHSGFYVFIVVLAFADIIYLTSIPITITQYLNFLTMDSGQVVCKLYALSLTFGGYAIPVLLLFLAGLHIHRVRRLSNHEFQLSAGGAIIICILLCIAILGLAIPMALFVSVTVSGDQVSRVYCFFGKRQHTLYYDTLQYTYLAFALGLFLSLVVISIFFCVRRKELKVSNGDGKISAMLIISLAIELTFVILYMAFFSVSVYFDTLTFFPSVVRPLLYIAFCPLLRNAAKWIITCGALCFDDDEEYRPLLEH